MGNERDVSKIRSQEGLTRCGTCRRHVVAGDRPSATRCPFCEGRAPLSFRGAALAGSLVMVGCASPAAEPLPAAHSGAESTQPAETPSEPSEPSVDTNEEQPVADGEGETDALEGEDSYSDDAPPMQPVARYGMAPMNDPEDRFEEPAPSMQPAPRYGRAPTPRDV